MKTLEKEGKSVDEAIWKALQEMDLTRDKVRIEVLDQGSKGLFGIGARPAKVLLLEIEDEEELDIRGFMRGNEETPPAAPARRTSNQRQAGKTPAPKSNSGRSPVAASPPAVEVPETEPLSDTSQRIARQLQQRSQAPVPPRNRNPNPTPTREQEDTSPGRTQSLTPPEVLSVPVEGAEGQLYSFLSELFQAMELPCVLSVERTENHIEASIYGDGYDLGLLIGKHGSTLDSLQYLSSLVVNRVSSDHIRVQIQIGDYRQRREETLIRLAQRTASRVMRDGRSAVLDPMPANERRLIHMTLQGHSHVITNSEGEEPRRYVVVSPRPRS